MRSCSCVHSVSTLSFWALVSRPSWHLVWGHSHSSFLCTTLLSELHTDCAWTDTLSCLKVYLQRARYILILSLSFKNQQVPWLPNLFFKNLKTFQLHGLHSSLLHSCSPGCPHKNFREWVILWVLCWLSISARQNFFVFCVCVFTKIQIFIQILFWHKKAVILLTLQQQPQQQKIFNNLWGFKRFYKEKGFQIFSDCTILYNDNHSPWLPCTNYKNQITAKNITHKRRQTTEMASHFTEK